MTLEHVTWAMKQDIKGAEYKVLIQLANRCNHHGIYDAGQEVLVATTGYKERAVREAVKKLREMNLLHTERQRSEFGLGRGVDIIVLHPQVDTYTLPDYIESPEEIELLRRSRELNETTREWGISPSQALPAKNAGKGNMPVDNFQQNDVYPSQSLQADFAGKARLTGKISSHTGTTIPVENVILPVEQKSALKGYARDARALKGSLLTDLNQSISQSGNTSTGARTFEQAPPVTNRLTDHESKNEICGIPTKDFIRQLRAGLARHRSIDTRSFSDEQLSIVVEEILFTRADLTKITKPVGFCINAIANEPGGILAILEAPTFRKRHQQQMVVEESHKHQAAVQCTCPIHNLDYPSGGECRSCAADRKAAPPEDPWSLPDPQNFHKASRDHHERQTA
ncbi:hypothetical protein [Rothia nasisuis]|uniref:hypothetical protein n=1 Tax=Rothia nasisuis TaxID=2109647 RepID=UPI001F309BA0|nr:hypothetical protein [Rothia nasisuis]